MPGSLQVRDWVVILPVGGVEAEYVGQVGQVMGSLATKLRACLPTMFYTDD